MVWMIKELVEVHVNFIIMIITNSFICITCIWLNTSYTVAHSVFPGIFYRQKRELRFTQVDFICT